VIFTVQQPIILFLSWESKTENYGKQSHSEAILLLLLLMIFVHYVTDKETVSICKAGYRTSGMESKLSKCFQFVFSSY
jgi:hypothetical protein